MLQELLVGVVEERKASINSGALLLLHDPSSSPFPISSLISQSQFSLPAPPQAAEPPQQKLRCPRCDSSNTKFCYYNNYNLTQPRHFCNTCRRYWTKGGALRNVPIGGVCRKAKMAPGSSKHPAKTKVASPVKWPTSSFLMNLLKHNHNSGSMRSRDDGPVLHARIAIEPVPAAVFKGRDHHGMCLDPLVHLPQPLPGHGVTSLRFQDLYQKLKISINEHKPLMTNDDAGLGYSSSASLF